MNRTKLIRYLWLLRVCPVLPATRREIRFMLQRKSTEPPPRPQRRHVPFSLNEGLARVQGTDISRGPTLHLQRRVCPRPTGRWASGQEGNSSFIQPMFAPLTQTWSYKAPCKALVNCALHVVLFPLTSKKERCWGWELSFMKHLVLHDLIWFS